MKFTVIIPARYASERLPGKPLLDIAGWPMIRHVHARAKESKASRVIVATDDQRIADAVSAFGGEVCMTRRDHRSGTDRLYDVAAQLGFADDEIVVNVQGDEPLIPPANINQVAANLHAHAMAGVSTLYEPIHDKAQFTNPNMVKVVFDARGYALYFSRAPIPWPRDAQLKHTASPQLHAHRHIGIYAYRVEFLREFVQWPPAPLEQIESLEQLRALHNGVHIHIAAAAAASPPGVDTADDLAHVRTLLPVAGK